MADVFHKDVPMEALARAWAVMAATPQHVYQILTKRHGRMHAVLSDPDGEFQGMVGEWRYLHGETDTTVPTPEDPSWGWPLPNVHLGVSVEDQEHADLRIPALLDTPAAVRFLSCEPLLASVDLTRVASGMRDDMVFDVLERRYGVPGQWQAPMSCDVAWVIVGGESGPGARPMKVDWVRSLVSQCQHAGVPVFVKQDSGPRPGMQGRIPDELWLKEFPEVPS
jgi:protein gp37